MSLGTNVIDSRDILLGTGQIKFGGIAVGQLKGDVVFTPSKEYKEFKAGVPQQTVKVLPFSEGATLKASMAELNGKNIARALGNAASSVTDTTPQKYSLPSLSFKNTGRRPAIPMPPCTRENGPAK